MEREILSIRRKALKINLDSSIYGTIAEIGGGQEVAREFFQAGGASGTIAKTISAYDKNYSDFLYNNNVPERYVSEERLVKMLDAEYNEVFNLLHSTRLPDTRFFAFADTVATLNYKKDNESHGWIGLRFQLLPDDAPNEIVLHVRLLENDGILQQYTLGALGVNLIYACYYLTNDSNLFLQSLIDNLSTDRVEINMVRVKGPQFKLFDNRLLAVQLVKNGMTPVTMFDRKGVVHQPSDQLYKKDVLLLRGSFRPITCIGFDMLKSGFAAFRSDVQLNRANTIILCEITLNNLLEEGSFNEKDYLDRVDLLNAMGQNVLITNYREYYRLVAYFSQFKIGNIRFLLSADILEKIVDPVYYSHLKAGILEAFGRLFADNVKLFVYPSKRGDSIITSEHINVSDHTNLLLDYLKKCGKIVDINSCRLDRLHINSHLVLAMIKNKQPGWEKMVLKNVASFIKDKKLFGYH